MNIFIISKWCCGWNKHLIKDRLLCMALQTYMCEERISMHAATCDRVVLVKVVFIFRSSSLLGGSSFLEWSLFLGSLHFWEVFIFGLSSFMGHLHISGSHSWSHVGMLLNCHFPSYRQPLLCLRFKETTQIHRYTGRYFDIMTTAAWTAAVASFTILFHISIFPLYRHNLFS